MNQAVSRTTREKKTRIYHYPSGRGYMHARCHHYTKEFHHKTVGGT